MTDLYSLGVAQRNRRIADQNANVAEQWMAYANKLKAKLTAIEQERDALRQQLEAVQARAVAVDALQDKIAAELANVSPSNPLVSKEHRNIIVETAVKTARAPQLQL
ncbi:hypothetical protein [Burkholderia gladioli]|uniref:hypothetical protein n=1 Tax=Burkholderia gladioli TaxID=28095 RepID=UPI001640FAE4|nr:hypothetical protein [Burkholderia gladioli]